MNWRSFGFESNTMYDTFAGVKYYIMKDGEKANEDYELVEKCMFNGEKWDVYENPYYFGMAYVRNKELSNRIWKVKVTYQT